MIMPGVRRTPGHGGVEVLRDEGGPRFVQDRSNHVRTVFRVLGDEQLVEEELVGETPDLGTAPAVDLIAAPDERQGTIECVLDVRIDHSCSGKGTNRMPHSTFRSSSRLRPAYGQDDQPGADVRRCFWLEASPIYS